jgi:diguanylate cyclase (GGDEF)-like protein
MGAASEILILLEAPESIGRLVRRSAGASTRIRVRRWGGVREEDFTRRGLQAVVYRSPGDPAVRRKCERLLQSLPQGVARVSLVPAVAYAGGSPRRAPGAPLRLAAPVDLRLLTALISMERRLQDLDEAARRSRRVAGQVSRYLNVLGEITRSSNAEFEPKRIVDLSIQKVRKLCPLEAWAVFLLDEEKSCLTLHAAGGVDMAPRVGSRLGVGEGMAGRVLRTRSPMLLAPSAGGSALPMPEIPEKLGWSEILGLPLLSRGKAIGVVQLIRGREQRPFRRRDVRALTMLLEPMAIAVENALLLKRSEELSITDDLTKLFNSRYLNSYLSREVQRSRRYGAKVSLIFLDLDGFKNVNDQHGHLAGSRALVEVGAVIRNMVREIDVVSRFGGDEFTVILPQTGPEGARVIAERMRQRVEETVFLETFALKARITASFGIATFPDHAQSKETLIQKADQAMYRVKGRGKNGVEMAE